MRAVFCEPLAFLLLLCGFVMEDQSRKPGKFKGPSCEAAAFSVGRVICAMLAAVLICAFQSPVAAAQNERLSKDQQAWLALMPEIEIFWHEYQTSPQKLSEDVWPFVSALKDYIKTYPKSPKIPEAYYILGEAYAAASYWPEAMAHWKIVIRYYPDSKWTSSALNSLVACLEKQGNQKKLKKFYKAVLRQFPDSVAARTTRVLLARQALMEGKTELVKRVVKQIEKSSPMAEVEIPELLDLKAGIALREGKPSEAISLWVRFINLKKSPVSRASALFNIAETYRTTGDWLKARKYYALLRRDFPTQPEALFARFRMLQMEEMQQERLSKYVKGSVRLPNLNVSERVYQKIVKRYPRYPLTQEVRKELIATEIKKKDYMRALKLSDDFIRTFPSGIFAKEVLALAGTAREKMLEGKFSTENLERMVNEGREYLGKKARNNVQKYLQEVTWKMWARLLRQLIDDGKPLESMEQYWSYREAFRKDPRKLKAARKSGVRALEETDRWFFSNGRYADLVNYYFYHEKGIESLKSSVHYHILAKAFSRIELDKMALRSYFRAWELNPGKNESCEILRDWTGQSLKADETVMAQNTITLIDLGCPDYSLLPDVLLDKSFLAGRQGDWIAAYNMARDSLAGKADGRSVYQALSAGIKLSEWDEIEDIYKKNSHLLSKEGKISILKEWGDEAVRLSEFKKAMVPYSLLLKIDKEDPSSSFRLAVAESGSYGFEKAMPVWETLSKKDRGIWGKAAKSEISFYRFMSGSAGQL